MHVSLIIQKAMIYSDQLKGIKRGKDVKCE